MNIGIDARLIGEKITGISRFLINVLKYIPNNDLINKYFLFSYQKPTFDNNFYSLNIVKKHRLPRQIEEHFWLNFSLPKILSDQNIEIFFTPYILVPYKKGKFKNVIVIHDVMTKACSQFFTKHYINYMSVIVPQAIKKSDAIITVSKSAKNDIIRYYDVPSDKITIMHLWTDNKYKPITLNKEEVDRLNRKYNLPEKFLLFVGAIEERKNILGILKISDILNAKGTKHKIVLIGAQGFGFDKLNNEIMKRTDRVIYLKYVEENDLPLIYNLAKIFIFPSFYEGFGLPALEAMKCGLPILAARNSSLIEVVGEGGLLFNAEDYVSFAESIIMLLNDEQFYTEMRLRAIKQSEKFEPGKEIIKLIILFNSLN